MLKEKRKKTAKESNPYDCALQLKDIINRSNLSPIMAMVLYEFLSDVVENRIAKNTSIYEHIQSSFEKKLRFAVLGNENDTQIRVKSKAYLVLLLEIISHSKLVTGVDMELQHLDNVGETCVNVRFDAKNFKVDKRGYEFIENVNHIRDKHISGPQMIDQLSKCTNDAVDYILERYKELDDRFEEGDVIVVDTPQA